MKTTYKRIILALVLAATFSILGAGCQTTKGFGKDVEKLGDKIQGE